MERAEGLLRSHAAAIASEATIHAEDDELGQQLCQLVLALAQSIGQDTPLDVSCLSACAPDDAAAARVLRCIEAEAIELLRRQWVSTEDAESAGTPAFVSDRSFQEAVLALRRRITESLPRPRVDPDEIEFYRSLFEADVGDREPRYRRLMDFIRTCMAGIPEMLFVFNLSGTILYANASTLDKLQYTRDDLLKGLSIYDIVVPDFIDLIEARMESPRAAIASPYTIELCSRDGHRIPVEICPRPLPDEHTMEAILCVGQDLRFQRRLCADVAQVNARFDALAELTPGGLMLLDSHQKVREASQEAAEILGAASSGDLLGKSIGDLVGENCREAVERALIQASIGNQTVRVALPGLSAFGKDFRGAVLAVKALTVDRAGTNGYMALVTPSSDRGDDHQFYRSERLSALGQIVAGVAHELNNPLTGALGYAQMLLTLGDDDRTRSRLEHVIAECQRCQQIVMGLLAFSSHVEGQRALYSINDLVNEVVTLRRYQLRVDGIEVLVEFADNPPPVMVDAYELQRVMLNIITNAQQALQEVDKDRRRLRVSTETEEGMVLICFEDTGTGIEPDAVERIFDPFFSTKGVGGGIGLGLSVSYGVVKAHGGELKVESEYGSGAAVTIKLPVGKGA